MKGVNVDPLLVIVYLSVWSVFWYTVIIGRVLFNRFCAACGRSRCISERGSREPC